jgi:16S rRNA (adenine1518-N6/adenine1519-N6)-dimethyltransferase
MVAKQHQRRQGGTSWSKGDPRVREVARELRDRRVAPRKERGQNFVVDPSVVEEIVTFGKPSPEEHIIEIGPGLGALTARLQGGASLTLIEIESSFCRALERRFPDAEIIEGDVRTVDIGALEGTYTVFGNLPYVFSSDIIFHLIASIPTVSRAVLLLQREFAERVAARPGSRTYGVLSVMAQLWSDVTLGPRIPGTSFHPTTQVESQVLRLDFFTKPRVDVGDPFWFRRIVQGSFHSRRKKLRNSLKAASLVPPGVIDESLERAGIDGDRRAETLSIAEFAVLANHIPAPNSTGYP